MSERELTDDQLEREASADVAANGRGPRPRLSSESRAIDLNSMRQAAVEPRAPAVLLERAVERPATREPAAPSGSDYFSQILQKAFDDGRAAGAKEERERIGRALLGM